MDNQIVIHAANQQKRIALIENGELAQFFIESPENRRSVGDIYLAQVHKVMGGIRAAFIDLSTPKDAFLHYSDLGEHLEEYLVMLNGRDAINKKASNELLEFRKKIKEKNGIQGMSNKETTAHEQNLIGNLLKPGQKIMVQIVKEPIGSKGPRVSTDITLAGRFLVLIPFGDYVAVSKRIRSYKERRRLRSQIGSMMPNGFGVIVRTVAEGQDEEALREDLKDLHDKWTGITEKLKESKPTALLHRDLDMTESLVRDLFSKNYSRILIDDPNGYKTIRNYISRIAPSMVKNVEQFKGREHIFDHMKISRDVESIFSPRVKMPSGGYLIFEQTEAMYVVDVNSGRYAAKKAQEDNSLRTNLEAAREIAKQLRLRDIGGIIVVDFIDLQNDSNRKKVYDEIKKEFRKDRAKTNILPMSDFGLMQITRQRIRPSVVKSVSKVCTMCGGSGNIVSENTLLSDLESWMVKFRHDYNYRSIDLFVNPYFHSVLTQGWISTRLKWMFKFRMRINIHPEETVSLNDFKVNVGHTDVDISEVVLEGGSIEEKIKEAELSLADLESEGKRDNTQLDIYKKDQNGNGRANGKFNKGGGRDKSAESSREHDDRRNRSDDSEKDRRPKPQARISPRGRNDRSKSKYYKSGSDGDSGQQDSKNSRDNVSKEKESIQDKPSALEVAREHARKVQAEEDTGSKKNDTTSKSDTRDDKAESKKTASTGKSDAETVKKSTDRKPAKPSQEKSADTGDSEKPGKTVKAPVKVKKSAKSPRRKPVAAKSATSDKKENQNTKTTDGDSDQKKSRDSKPDSDAGKKAPSEKKTEEKTEDTGKSKNIDKMDEVKASLSEEQFRKPASAPVSESSASPVKKSIVKKRTAQKSIIKEEDNPEKESEQADTKSSS